MKSVHLSSHMDMVQATLSGKGGYYTLTLNRPTLSQIPFLLSLEEEFEVSRVKNEKIDENEHCATIFFFSRRESEDVVNIVCNLFDEKIFTGV